MFVLFHNHWEHFDSRALFKKYALYFTEISVHLSKESALVSAADGEKAAWCAAYPAPGESAGAGARSWVPKMECARAGGGEPELEVYGLKGGGEVSCCAPGLVEVAGCGEGDPDPPSSYPAELGLRRFSFCLRLQNHTLTTSFSSWRESARLEISWAAGLGFLQKCCSSAPLMETSMEVLFFRFLPWAAILSIEAEVPVVESASASHFFRRGISLHMFLKDSWSASNRHIVVCEKTLP